MVRHTPLKRAARVQILPSELIMLRKTRSQLVPDWDNTEMCSVRVVYKAIKAHNIIYVWRGTQEVKEVGLENQ